MMVAHATRSSANRLLIGAGQVAEAVRRRGRSLRAKLLVLVLAGILPITAAALGLLVWNAVLQQRDQEAMLLARARVLADLVDQKLRTSLVALQTLSLSRRLAEGDLAAFYEQALALRDLHPEWQSVLVIDPSGQQRLNLLRPLGDPLPNVARLAVIHQVIATGQPLISGVFVGPLAGEPIVAVTYPVHQDNRLSYILANNIPARLLGSLLAYHQPDLDLRAVITDRDGRIVARSVDHDTWVGQTASPWFTAGAAAADEGILTGRTLDGYDVKVAFTRSQLAGWVVGVSVPIDVLQAPLRRSLVLAAGISIASLLVSAGFALWFGRAITRPIAGLVAAARAISRRQDPGSPAPSAISEFETLQRVMTEAGREVSMAARTQRARIVSIFRSMTDGVVEVDRDWRITLINEHAQAWLAGGREVRGMTLWGALPEALGRAVQPQCQRVLDAQVPVEFEASCPLCNAWYGVRAFPTPQGVAVYLQDITPRKQAEQALRESEERHRIALDSASLGTWNFDLVTGTIYWDERCRTLFGVGAGQTLNYDSVIALIHPDDRVAVDEAVKRSLDPTATGWYEAEYRVPWHDGSVHWVAARGQAYFAGAGADRRPVRFIGTVMDITARKQAEMALRESEAQLRRALAEAPFPVMLHAEDGTVLQLSRSWTEITGYTAEAILTVADWTERAYGERRDLVHAGIDRLYALDRRLDEGEFVVTTAYGGRRIWEFASAPLGPDAHGRRLAVSMAVDVTERKAAEAALRANMAELETVLDAVPAAVFIAHDRACRRITGSRYADELLSLSFGTNTSRSAPAGEPPATFRAVRDGVDIPPELQPMQLAASGVAVRNAELKLALADGRCLDILGNAVPLRDAAGETCGAVGAFIDITARKTMEALLLEQEGRLQLAIDSVNAGIWDWDTRSDRVYLSPKLKAILGYEDDFPDSNSAWLALVHPEDLPLFKKRAREALTNMGHRYMLEYRGRHKDGTYRWIQSNALVLRDHTGVPVRMTGLDLDITEQKRAQLALQDSERRQKTLQQQLLQVSRLSAIGEVASTLAHELNQPLTATMNYVQAARRMGMAGMPEAADRVRELMDKAVGQATRASTILRRVRAFIKVDNADRSLESLNEVVREAGILGASGAAETHITVRFDLAPDLPSCLMDKVQIQQVVFNLVRNAVEAMADAQRRELTVRTSRTGSGAVEVAVCDTGPGVAPEVKDCLFYPFATTKANGMGLGLAICRSIVEAHNGRVWAAPNPEGGAIFRFCLPIAQQDGRNDAE